MNTELIMLNFIKLKNSEYLIKHKFIFIKTIALLEIYKLIFLQIEDFLIN